jgi:ribose 5-phosphate isomerase B
MQVALGCDHRGFQLKMAVIDFLKQEGYGYHDYGCFGAESVDYPDFAQPVAESVAAGKSDFGILICATGIGMSIAANKVKGVRAALCCNALDAQLTRQHNDANVLCLSGDKVLVTEVAGFVRNFLITKFDGGRHSRRLDKVRAIEAKFLDNA